ncbi:MAG TPA: type I methionyl aminopeptidase [Armatimonadota bacterium]|nr:type I methionyl aminopeptidase [Armatimonadota bacterium]
MTGSKRKTRHGRRRHIALKDGDAIAQMKRAGQVVALVLDRLAEAARPGVTTGELDRLAEAVIRSFGATPTFYGLYGYPANICVSVNDEVVHGIPGDRPLQEGDIVSFDVGATVADMIADAASTVGVGDISEEAGRLLRVTREALHKGIEQARPGNRVSDISAAVQGHAESHGYSVVRKLVGHGVGYDMHEPPHVPNFVDGATADSPELVPGMTLAIEPMINLGTWHVTQDDDGWTYRTKDGSLSAHFEHTIAITEEACEILTARTAAGGAGAVAQTAPQTVAQRARAGG